MFFVKKKSGIWSGLYQFPSIEFSKNLTNDEILESEGFLSFFRNQKFHLSKISSAIIHKLTHQRIHVKFLHINCATIKNVDFISVNYSEIHKIPVSRLIDKYLSMNNICKLFFKFVNVLLKSYNDRT